jgi:hypothetical protein
MPFPWFGTLLGSAILLLVIALFSKPKTKPVVCAVNVFGAAVMIIATLWSLTAAGVI